MPVKGHKYIFIFFMTDYFKKLVAEYNSAKSDFLKGVIYDAMIGYVEEYHEGYVCYDMDMYVALYKCSTTPGQRAYALKQIDEIIIDNYIYNDDIIENFKEFVSLRRFLHPDDVVEFDILCLKVLHYFEARVNRASLGDKYCSLDMAEEELSQVVKIITEGDGMSDLGCYHQALKVSK